MLCRPLCERRKLLEQNISPVKNHIMLSEQTLVKVSGVGVAIMVWVTVVWVWPLCGVPNPGCYVYMDYMNVCMMSKIPTGLRNA